MGKRRRFDKINSIAILIIALSALFVSVWQGIETRNFNKLSMTPYLKYKLTNADSVLTLSIRNVGQGVAIITDMEVKVDGKPYDSWEEALAAISEDMSMLRQLWISSNEIITSQENITLMSSTIADFGGKQLSIDIEYESMYGDKMNRSFSYSWFR